MMPWHCELDLCLAGSSRLSSHTEQSQELNPSSSNTVLPSQMLQSFGSKSLEILWNCVCLVAENLVYTLVPASVCKLQHVCIPDCSWQDKSEPTLQWFVSFGAVTELFPSQVSGQAALHLQWGGKCNKGSASEARLQPGQMNLDKLKTPKL